MGFKVLIVEDSRLSREMIVDALKPIEGLEIVHANGGFAALKLLPRHRFNLILTDIQMPDINGWELINFVKKNPNYRDTPLFIVTSQGSPEDRERGRLLGAVEYVVKPFEPTGLETLVRRYVNP